MKTHRNTRFDLFGKIINDYPSKVYQNTTPIAFSPAKIEVSDKATPSDVMGEILHDYPVNVYKAPGSKHIH